VPGYEILAELGRGGMGVVYQARQTALDRIVALKMILAGAHAGTEERRRFQAEAEAAARLQHPNIVQIHEVGEAGGLPYFSLEFCPGGSLADRLRGEPLPPREAARFTETLARAVQAAHAAGIVHRDLKPANVLLAADGTPKITDFGLAKRLDAQPAQTASGALVGTPSYMAPEQAGCKNKEIGPATDVYALGAILYELLTGRPPFKAETPLDTAMLVLTQEPVPPRRLQPKVPRDLETLCLKCLHKEPGKRYPSARGLADDLRCFLGGQPIVARPAGAGERALKWSRRRPAAAALVAVSVLAAVSLAVGGVWFTARLESARAQAEFERDRAKEAGEAARLSEAKAGASAAQAEQARGRATDSERLARRRFYAAQVNLAQRAWEDSHVVRVLALLDELHPGKPGDEDLRSFEWHYLHHLCHQGQRILRGHADWVSCASFSRDGQRLASVSEDGTARVWDFATGREVLTIRGLADGTYNIAFSPDGKRLATDGPRPKVWDAATGREVLALPVRSSGIAFTPDGKRLAVVNQDVRLLDADTGEEALRLKEEGFRPQRRWALGPDGKALAVSTVDEQRKRAVVKVWDLDSGHVGLTLSGHGDVIESVAFSADGKVLASGSYDQTVRLWDAHTGKELRTLRGHTGDVCGLAFSPDGQVLASANFVWPDADSAERVVKLWDVAGGQEIGTLRGHTGAVMGVGFHPGGGHLVTASLDHTVRLWDLSAVREARTVHTSGRDTAQVAVSPDGRRLAWASADGTGVCDLDTGRAVCTIPHDAAALAFSPDGRTLASADRHQRQPGKVDVGGRVKVWDAQSGKELRVFDGFTGVIQALVFSPDGGRLAVAHGDLVTVRDAATGRELWARPRPGAGGTCAALRWEGQHLTAAGPDLTVTAWDGATGEQTSSASAHHGAQVLQIVFSPDGQRLASVEWTADDRGAGQGVTRVWDAATLRELIALAGHGNLIRSATFSADGQRLVTGSDDRTVKVWDVLTGQEMLTLRGHEGGIHALAFSPDGQRLVTADGPVGNTRSASFLRAVHWNFTVKVWEVSEEPASPDGLGQREGGGVRGDEP
jgi:WD40 repeat protein